MIYLDHNGTTAPKTPKSVVDAMSAHIIQSNPSGSYKMARDDCDIMKAFKSELLVVCNAKPTDYDVIITSGASEANNYIISGAVQNYFIEVAQRQRPSGAPPAIVLIAIEHKTSVSKAFSLKKAGWCEVFPIYPRRDGRIHVEDAKKVIAEAKKAHTVVLVSVMSANNETGICNNIRAISAFCQANNILFHTDITAQFGKYSLDLTNSDIPAASLSFHKLYGPTFCGALILHRRYLATTAVANQIVSQVGNSTVITAPSQVSRIPPLIAGTQNSNLRGGTENIALIAGAREAMRVNFAARDKKNGALASLRAQLFKALRANGIKIIGVPDELFDPSIDTIAKECAVVDKYWADIGAQLNGRQVTRPDNAQLLDPVAMNMVCINVLRNQMPHIISCCFVYNQANRYVAVDKIRLKDMLDARNLIISTGSACSKGNASYVMKFMAIPDQIALNPIRISMGDYNTGAEMAKAGKIFAECAKNCRE